MLATSFAPRLGAVAGKALGAALVLVLCQLTVVASASAATFTVRNKAHRP